MKNWVLYFFAVLFFTITLPLLAKSSPIAPETPIIVVNDGEKVSETDLETYTLRAMLLQSDQSQSYETKKALAVAIRSQAYYLSVYGLNHEKFDVCVNDGCCFPLAEIQSYDGDFLQQCKNAVAETEGFVLLNDGKPAMTLFCVCSGSGTADCETFPYLKGIPEDEKCILHKTEKIIPLSQLGFSLSESDSCVVYDRWNKCAFAVADGKYINSEELQDFLGLQSSELTLEFNEGFVTAVSYGAGNQFGMSLCGAEKLAKQGSDFQTILKKYYPLLELIYNN